MNTTYMGVRGDNGYAIVQTTRIDTLVNTNGSSDSCKENHKTTIMKICQEFGVSKKIAENKVIHHIFDECINYTSDGFWKKRLFEAARGKFPTGFSYANHNLRLLRKKNTKTIVVHISDNPVEAIKLFMDLMKSVNIRSNIDEDYENEINVSAINESSNVLVSWNKLSNNLQHKYIIEYIGRISLAYGISKCAQDSLYDLLVSHNAIKLLNINNVIINEFGIINVDGVLYHKETDKFYFNPAMTKSLCDSSKKVKIEEQSITNANRFYKNDYKKMRKGMVKISDKIIDLQETILKVRNRAEHDMYLNRYSISNKISTNSNIGHVVNQIINLDDDGFVEID